MARRNPNLSMTDMLLTMGEELHRTAYTPNINAYKPHDKQTHFHTSEKRRRLYIGGNRSGKTTGGIVEDIWWLTRRHPFRTLPDRPIAGRIVCVDFLNGIEKIVKPQLKQWIPPSELRGGCWSDAYEAYTRTLYLENGSFVELMSYDQDLDKFAGTSRDFVHFDEEPPEAIYTENMARLVDRKGSMWMTMTPVEGMTWIYDELYEKGKMGDPNINITEVDMTENPYLDQDEVRIFLDSLGEDERLARGSGQFVQMGGLVYKAFHPDIHLVDPVEPRSILGSNFKHYLSLDHGFNNPTAALWHAVDIDNQVLTYDEHYESGKIIEYHAKVIHDRNVLHGCVPSVNVCDPALGQHQGVTGTSIQTEYAIRGIGFLLGNNDVQTGVAKVNEYLTVLRADGRPQWLITKNCGNLIREIMRLRWQTWSSRKQQGQNNPYEKIHKKDDHACDSVRYFFTLMPNLKQTAPLPVAAKKVDGFGHTAVKPNEFRIDPALTPAALKGLKTEWTKVDLGE
jgi:phage terminase large subunit-like protein